MSVYVSFIEAAEHFEDFHYRLRKVSHHYYIVSCSVTDREVKSYNSRVTQAEKIPRVVIKFAQSLKEQSLKNIDN